jgi:hypothetical protein
MPVNASVHQPMGLLHGGASGISESVFLMWRRNGIEISNHLRSIIVIGTALTRKNAHVEIKLPMRKEFDLRID